ncbi:hypothetical protein B0T10DRAFT_238799 [Thelonectria olida]|uniref:Uncharacterized protein n=1 Tax=Thelonectria olida TaxID=1576542 RepID=A0A9P8WAT2_9HYPO|nr:hypothetical protein B0T10DRAFT_238799 [Thelonectria olida]
MVIPRPLHHPAWLMMTPGSVSLQYLAGAALAGSHSHPKPQIIDCGDLLDGPISSPNSLAAKVGVCEHAVLRGYTSALTAPPRSHWSRDRAVSILCCPLSLQHAACICICICICASEMKKKKLLCHRRSARVLLQPKPREQGQSGSQRQATCEWHNVKSTVLSCLRPGM